MSTVMKMDNLECQDTSNNKDSDLCKQCNGKTQNFDCRKQCLCPLVEGHHMLTLHKNSRHYDFLSKLKLRFLCGDDIPCLKELCNEWFPIKYPDSWYNLVVFNEKFYSMAATLDDKIVAVLIAEIKPRHLVPKEDADLLSYCFHKDTKVAYILSLGVHHPHRRHGVASFLLKNFLWYISMCLSKSALVKAVYLHVLTTNLVAIKFYQGHNFKLLHYLPSYYMINGLPNDGYSYVLYINGGKSKTNCMDYFTAVIKFLQWLRFCHVPKKLCGILSYTLQQILPGSSPAPFISKSRQCHNL
uniref:N-alpha-acetyltransferase 60 n=1 Tax=Phallusia mammillata TaxID=59560 RepID=A0A6F9DLW4_9ASCI|nr:N-alpha-acetyltransferase 60-like [Phallusia mammillata]